MSRRLRDLENLLGVQLFERTNGGTRPTLAGQEFLRSAMHILTEVDASLRKLQTRSRGENGQLVIGVYASPSRGNMYTALVEHHQTFPDVEVHTVDGDHRKLLWALSNNEIDIAIMTSNRSSWDDRTLALWGERVILALYEPHPLVKKDIIQWSDLANECIVVPQYGPGPELEQLLASKLGCRHQRLLHQASGLDRLLSLVSARYGLLLMLEGGTGVHFDGVVYRELHDVDGHTRLNFSAYWRQSNDNPTLAPFVTMLRQRYPDFPADRASD